jgi:nucleosome binding factor SPN SPT16 subunit
MFCKYDTVIKIATYYTNKHQFVLNQRGGESIVFIHFHFHQFILTIIRQVINQYIISYFYEDKLLILMFCSIDVLRINFFI